MIAKSGSLAFKKDLDAAEKDKADIDVIGQFGVGFYSAFMVASKVTVVSRAYGQETANRWESEGADGYTVTPCEKETVGTDVILTMKPDTEDDCYSVYLMPWKIQELVKKYSDYVRWPIVMDVEQSDWVDTGEKDEKGEPKMEMVTKTEEQTINSMVPIWQRSRKEATDEECIAFYKDKFHDKDDPLAVIRVNAEGLISYRALLFIPAKAPANMFTRESDPGLELYSSGVMIMDKCTDLLPPCYAFARGVVDSPDLSLNISREMLQHDRQLKLIATNLGKKIKSELKAMLENDREKYEEFYAAFGRQLKYGTVSDYGAHKEATQDLLLFYSHKQGKLISLKEYVDAMAEGQEKIYYAPGENKERLSKLPQVETLTKKGYDVLLFTEDVDEFVPQTLMTYMEKPFCNVSTEDLGLQTEEEKKQAEEKAEEMKGLLTFVKETLGDRVKEVKLSSELGSHPVCMTPAEGMSFEMEKYMKRANPEFAFPVGRVLELNPEHEAVQAMQKAMTEDPEKAKDYAKLLCCQAQLMAELPLDDPYAYTELVCRLMK